MKFLDSIEHNEDITSSMTSFMASCDIVIMGKTTYLDIIENLSPNKWPYESQKSYIVSNSLKETNIKNVEITNLPLKDLALKVKKEAKKNIWLLGGAKLAQGFHNEGLIDKYILDIAPIILGKGIKLFEEGIQKQPLKLLEVKKLSNCTHITYIKDL